MRNKWVGGGKAMADATRRTEVGGWGKEGRGMLPLGRVMGVGALAKAEKATGSSMKPLRSRARADTLLELQQTSMTLGGVLH